MTAKLVLTLSDSEHAALIDLATTEQRDPRAEARILLRRGLVSEGLLPPGEPLSLSRQSHNGGAVVEAGNGNMA